MCLYEFFTVGTEALARCCSVHEKSRRQFIWCCSRRSNSDLSSELSLTCRVPFKEAGRKRVPGTYAMNSALRAWVWDAGSSGVKKFRGDRTEEMKRLKQGQSASGLQEIFRECTTSKMPGANPEFLKPCRPSPLFLEEVRVLKLFGQARDWIQLLNVSHVG